MSEMIVNKLTGKTSAGDIDVVSEGGGATMQLQQGLAKAWIKFNGSGTATINGSLNISSLDDNGTGNYDINYSNVFADVNSAPVGMSNWNGVCTHDAYFTSYHNLATRDSSTTSKGDRSHVTISVHGDLA